ncbi:Hypothetical protein R9X50_00585600 [Acrodontium crateriforme]|uniref:Pre-mRNA-splicing factor CWC24 n=1 Tax=Acrodontium crateriforme TaxID=150365 RepID=A0AAQ3R9G4_9PEZI|nr:Hypothetical protein R9X50_00585600 [Acrodontium crateriforme]
MADVAVPSFKKRSNKTTNLRKRPATPPPVSDSDDASDDTDDDNAADGRVKRRKKNGVQVNNTAPRPSTTTLSKTTAYEADRSTTLSTNDDATKTSNWSNEAAAESVRNAAAAQKGIAGDDEGAGNGTYKGTAKYSNFIQKPAEARGGTVGPVKAATNVRQITVTDFAPDVCKDYKQTGFCGFGDSCKFLHAREDYKQGWQLDKEWEKVGNNKAKSGTGKTAKDTEELDDEAKLLESIPFACIICKEAYKRPIVTRCGHYFCEKCAMTRYMKEKKRTCANCGADTNGTFNVARKLNELLEKKRKRVREKKAEARERGEEVSDDDDDDS